MSVSTANAPKPNEFASNEEKLNPKYGYDYARYIDSQHYINQGFIDQQGTWLENERYRSGTQSNINVKKYLLDGRDKSYGKLNFTPLNIIPKYVKTIKKSLNLPLFNSKVKAIDSTSVEMRQGERDELISKMINGQFNANMSAVTGIDFNAKGFIPEDDRDIDVYMETESILPQEIAMEQAISVVKEANGHEEVKDRLADDALTYGRCIIKDDYDPDLGVVEKRIAPINYITSFDGSEMNDNRGSFYDGHIEMMPLNDLVRIYGMTKDQGLEFYNRGSNRQEYVEKLENKRKWDDISNTMVKVLFFEFRTTMTDTYRNKTRRNGRKTVDVRGEGYNINDKNIETLKSVHEVWIEGVWVVDATLGLNYGVRKNMLKDSLKKVRSSYSSYDTNEMPMVRKLIPFADNMNLAIVKMNQMIASARPKGVAINLSALLDIPNPDGAEGKMSYLNLVRRFDETGNQLYRLDEFGAGQGIPITELENGLPSDIGKYVDIYNHNLQQINNITGVNPTMAGMGAASRVSTESNEIALQSSIKAVEFVKDAVLSVEKRFSENVVLRLQDIDKYGDKPFKKYVQALGIHNMEALNALEGLDPFTYSLYVEMLPDADERKELNEDMTIAMQAGLIDVTDKMDVQNITNLKLASAVLKRRIKSNEAKRHQRSLELEQQKQQTKQIELQMKGQEMQTKFQYDSQLSQQEYLQEKDLLAMKLQLQQQENFAKQATQAAENNAQKVHDNNKTVYQQNQMNERQDQKLEAMKKQQLSKDSEKSMKKTQA
jgi:hypothetical protein